jgi:hypothetical protein
VGAREGPRARRETPEQQALRDRAEQQALRDGAEQQALRDRAEQQALRDRAEQQALRDGAAEPALSGLTISERGRWEGEEVVVDLDAASMGAALRAAE